MQICCGSFAAVERLKKKLLTLTLATKITTSAIF
jgi:hypothetical protein